VPIYNTNGPKIELKLLNEHTAAEIVL